jgi:hypothetical protein
MTLGASLLVSTIVWPPIDKLLFGPESVFNIFLRAIKARTDVQRMTDHHTGVPENNR